MKYSGCFPAWGPYSKKYLGISRVAQHDFAEGVRFDFTVVPSIFGFDINVPNVTVPSGWHPWSCSADYSFYSYRCDLEWKDRVYADVSFSRVSDEVTLVRTEIVNNSELVQNCLVNFFSSIEYPAPEYCELSLPEKCEYIDAREYARYEYAVPRPWDEQNADGMKKGEFADARFVGGFGLGDRAPKWHMPHRRLLPFGGESGDTVAYKIDAAHGYADAVLVIRYRTSGIEYRRGEMVGVNTVNGTEAARFVLNGATEAVFEPADFPSFAYIPLGEVKAGKNRFDFVSSGAGAVEFDFLCIAEKADACAVAAQMKKHDFTPEITEEETDGGYISTCRYAGVDGVFTLRTFSGNTRYRRIETGALEDCLTARLSNSDVTFDDVTESFTGAFSRKHSDDGFFHNAIVHTLYIEPGKSHVEYAVLSKGETQYLAPDEYEIIYLGRKAQATPPALNAAGKKYELSNSILRATLLTNAVYPIYKRGEYIIHHTPGKRWDCLYTWDSGFIGLGMLDCSPEFAFYSLDTYLSREDNPDYAFLHHGSPVPVQMYLYLEALKRSNDKSALLALYPRAKLYYDFLAGKVRGSTTAKFHSGLTTTYDYFYSSSGMDDYPAQVAMMQQDIRDTAAPVISTSQVIRCAKILSMVASKLGNRRDAAVYESDAQRLTDALNKYSWDEESGYFGYVLHDAQYNPTGIFKAENGENLNKGLDGIYPIIAGACNEEQRARILGHLMSEKEMLSPFGISAVDMTAGYFMVNGYWNGNVWFPHQWFIWKSMLDLAQGDFAFKIASLALDIWKREVDYSYYTFEMVSVTTGRGGWFHNFGGLSSPINMWTNAYYRAGTLNTGLEMWVDSVDFRQDNTALTAELTYFGSGSKSTVIAVMNDAAADYSVTVNGEKADFVTRAPGTIEITLPCKKGKAIKIEVGAAKRA